MASLAWYAQEVLAEFLSYTEGNYLEIGIFNGGVIEFVAQKNSSKMCYGVDPFIEDGCTSWITQVEPGNPISTQREIALNRLQNLKNTKIFQYTSQDFLEQLTPAFVEALNITCVFVDGDHSAEAVLNDCKLAEKLIGNKKGLIFFDDWDKPSVRETAEQYFKTDYVRFFIDNPTTPGVWPALTMFKIGLD